MLEYDCGLYVQHYRHHTIYFSDQFGFNLWFVDIKRGLNIMLGNCMGMNSILRLQHPEGLYSLILCNRHIMDARLGPSDHSKRFIVFVQTYSDRERYILRVYLNSTCNLALVVSIGTSEVINPFCFC